MSDKETDKAEKREILKPKMVSLIGKIISGTVVLGGFILYWFGKLPNATPRDIILCGLTMLGIICGTIDANIMIDKFTK